MERPLHRKWIGLLGLVGFFLVTPLAEVIHNASGLPKGLFSTLLYGLATGVIGYAFDGLKFGKFCFVLILIGNTILHVTTPFGLVVQEICFVVGTSLACFLLLPLSEEGAAGSQ